MWGLNGSDCEEAAKKMRKCPINWRPASIKQTQRCLDLGQLDDDEDDETPHVVQRPSGALS